MSFGFFSGFVCVRFWIFGEESTKDKQDKDNEDEKKSQALILKACDDDAADRGRTGTDFTPRDFKSLVSAYSTTAAILTLIL